PWAAQPRLSVLVLQPRVGCRDDRAAFWRLGPERDWCGDRMASLAAPDEIAESAEITGTKGTEKADHTEQRSNGGQNGEDCKKTRATGGRQRRPRVIVTDRRNIQTRRFEWFVCFVDP